MQSLRFELRAGLFPFLVFPKCSWSFLLQRRDWWTEEGRVRQDDGLLRCAIRAAWWPDSGDEGHWEQLLSDDAEKRETPLYLLGLHVFVRRCSAGISSFHSSPSPSVGFPETMAFWKGFGCLSWFSLFWTIHFFLSLSPEGLVSSKPLDHPWCSSLNPPSFPGSIFSHGVQSDQSRREEHSGFPRFRGCPSLGTTWDCVCLFCQSWQLASIKLTLSYNSKSLFHGFFILELWTWLVPLLLFHIIFLFSALFCTPSRSFWILFLPPSLLSLACREHPFQVMTVKCGRPGLVLRPASG